MKVAISIPDPIFRRAEQLARRLKQSRSQLYAKAIADYVGDHGDETVTEKLNAVHSVQPARIDKALERAQLSTLDDEAW